MKPTEKQIAEVRKYIKKWKPRLFLGEWMIFDKYLEANSQQFPERAAQIIPDVQYSHAVIEIFPRFWESSKKVREHAIVHELAHCISEELYQHVNYLLNDELVTRRESLISLERVTQRIANIAFQDEWK